MFNNTCLLEELNKIGIELDFCQLDLLRLYIGEIEANNQVLSLIKFTNQKELIQKHIVDSLLPYREFFDLFSKHACDIYDIGSGAGLPGIPLAIAFPNESFILVERMVKRAMFIKRFLKIANIINAKVLISDTSNLGVGVIKQAVSRATFTLDLLDKSLFKTFAVGSNLYLYRGKKDLALRESEGLKHFSVNTIYDLISECGERTLLHLVRVE